MPFELTIRTDETEGVDVVADFDFLAVLTVPLVVDTADVALRVARGIVPSPVETPIEPLTGVACVVLVVAVVVFVIARVPFVTAAFVNTPTVDNTGVAVTLLAAAGAVAIPVLIIRVLLAFVIGVAIVLDNADVRAFAAVVATFLFVIGVAVVLLNADVVAFMAPAVVAAFVFVIGVAIVLVSADVAAFVAPASLAAGSAAAVKPPPTASPAPLTIAGVAGELIDEFTVT